MSGRPDPGEGRALYGQDPVGYARGRPSYPEAVFDILRERCGLAEGCRVVEIGPGTGLATQRLLELGAHVTAVEPNDAMAEYLSKTLASRRLRIVAEPFETASLLAGGFDLAVAANAFHWVAQPDGFRQLRRVLRPGGWAAIWWMLFAHPAAPDAVSRLVEGLVREEPGSAGEKSELPFDLDEVGRRTELADAGFGAVESTIVWSTITLSAADTRALYASMAAVLRRAPDEQARMLDAIEALVAQQCGGQFARETPTAVYTAVKH